MNVVVLTGNLTKNPELRSTTGSNPVSVCRFGIANNEGYGDKKQTNFLNVVVFGKQAENCEKFLKKGSKIAILGRLQTGSYEKDGRKVYTTDIVAQNVEFLNTDKKDDDLGKWENTDEPAKGFAKVEDDDIPF